MDGREDGFVLILGLALALGIPVVGGMIALALVFEWLGF